MKERKFLFRQDQKLDTTLFAYMMPNSVARIKHVPRSAYKSSMENWMIFGVRLPLRKTALSDGNLSKFHYLRTRTYT